MSTRRAFTLIELLLAMAIGLFVVGTAFYAFRSAVASISAANRRALENSMLRQGVVAVMEEADFWTWYDAPGGDAYDSANGQGLRPAFDNEAQRRTKSGNYLQQFPNTSTILGRPFTPFRDLAAAEEFFERPLRFFDPAASASLLAARADASISRREYDRGWSVAHWSAADPRTWFRGDISQQFSSDNRHGRYGLVSHVRTNPQLGDTTGFYTRNFASSVNPTGTPTGDFGTVETRHSWRDNQLLGLRHALGYYGLLDYLPANVVMLTQGSSVPRYPNAFDTLVFPANTVGDIACFMDIDDRPYLGWLEVEEMLTLRDSTSRLRSWFPGRFPIGARHDMGTAVGLLPWSPYAGLFGYGNPPIANNALTSAAFVHESGEAGLRSWRHGGDQFAWNGSNKQGFAQIMGRVHLFRPLMHERPTGWPELYLAMKRYYVRGRFITQGGVRWADPQTGALQEVTFPIFGTNLRGARQQRHRDGGWAVWRARGHADNSPTLDDP